MVSKSHTVPLNKINTQACCLTGMIYFPCLRRKYVNELSQVDIEIQPGADIKSLFEFSCKPEGQEEEN